MNSVTNKYNKAVRFTTALTQSKRFENTLTRKDHKLFLRKLTDKNSMISVAEIVRTPDKGKKFLKCISQIKVMRCIQKLSIKK